jgi:hypothetical protein
MANLLVTLTLAYLLPSSLVRGVFDFQVSSPNWAELESSTGQKFTARNAHATTVFNGVLYLTGGKSDQYEMYKTLDSVKRGDVWKSYDGADWEMQTLEGDYYIQNADALQPGTLAPWWERFGHSLDAIDIDDDGVHDFMIQIGGFTPDPMRDIWLTDNGTTWAYCGEAPFSGRGWHSTVVFQGKLYVIGGSPFNNEVWRLESIEKTTRREPSTRASYLNYTYSVDWTFLGDAGFSPRAGASIVSQFYYNTTLNETMANSTERMVLIGGFGGWLEDHPFYDGFRSRGDVWASSDGSTWSQLTDGSDATALPPRAWSSAIVVHNRTYPGQDIVTAHLPPRILVFGGGYTGGNTKSTKVTTIMKTYADAYFSRDGVIWTRINYAQGGGTRGTIDTYVQFFSSQEWTGTTVDSATAYLGIWGHTTEFCNGTIVLSAGDKGGGGSLESRTWGGLAGLHCDLEGIICSNAGECAPEGGLYDGCVCSGGNYGEYCQYTADGTLVVNTPAIGL